MARWASVNIYTANWEQRYDLWQKKLFADPSQQPYAAQQMVLRAIHDRCVLEHEIENATIAVQAAKQAKRR